MTWILLGLRNGDVRVSTMWFTNNFEDIIRNDMGIPLSDEMIKQCKTKWEGDTTFFNRLAYMTSADYVDHEKKTVTPVELTDKQINFLARMLFQFYDVDVLALKDACIRGLISGVRTKDIEDKIREVVSRKR